MHVMIATDGSLDATKAATIAANLTHDGGHVTVLTVVEVPRQMLSDMRHAATQSSGVAPRDVDPEFRRSQASDRPVTHWAGDDATIGRYVNGVVAQRTKQLVTELAASDVEHTVVGVEGENAARSVLEAIESHQPDVLCIGTHGLGRFEGLLGSSSTKLARRAPCSVVLVR